LLGRYIAEERDTLRQFQCCYEQLKAAGGSTNGSSASAAGTGLATSAELRGLEAKVDALCATVEQLCSVVAAPAMAGNSKKK